MFPYPSGEGLHVGHPKGYIATDVYSRMKRMQGYGVLHPMGWDAFGLPAENYAIKTKTHPRKAVEKNIARYKEQLSVIGFDYDWEREVNTTDPNYYKWTQWIFIKLFEKGLAYESHAPINWCPSCQTGLANEDVESDGTCERCGTKVEKRPMRQWVLKITEYADRLLNDLDSLSRWPDHIKEMQRNWIGRSEGAELEFEVVGRQEKIKVFTTRPDTLYGATYVVLAPEHPLLYQLQATNADEVRSYSVRAAEKTEIERTAEGKEKTGVELKGVTAVNPATKEHIPIYVADYVLANYGTGAVMAVPAHDERDYAFAKKFNLPLRQVVVPCAQDAKNPPQEGFSEVTRNTVIVFLKNKSNGKYALLDWHGTLEGITTGIMGGVEEGQDWSDAVHEEIKGEAALTGVKIVKEYEWLTAARYCASHKQENRCAIARAYLAEVDDVSKQGEIAAHELKNHTLVWVDEDEVLDRLVPAHQKMVWQLLHHERALTEHGFLINSGKFDGLESEDAKKKITEEVGGTMLTRYKLQDWVFSRQRYWGEPIPIVHCEKDGAVAVPLDQLPVALPEVEQYAPTGTGESPLAAIHDWVNTICPKCGGPAKRETNTMPQWAGSCWYYLRYIDPKNGTAFVNPQKEKSWMPVDLYVGGAEHATRHLIYARFWHKFLFDLGVVSTIEPFTELHSVGLILAEDGRKMSKRWGNVVNPDDIVVQFGADSLRVYEMFMGPFGNAVAWSTNGLVGARRFIERVWRLRARVTDDGDSHELLVHQTIKKIGDDIQVFKFNTAISQLMICLNGLETSKTVSRATYESFLKLLAPFAPHVSEELWNLLGNKRSIHLGPWPDFDPSKLDSETVTIAVQVSGKTRGTLSVNRGATQDEVLIAIRKVEKMAQNIPISPSKVIFVPNRVINVIP
jgi:leucyl-tRNA synthetase